MDAAHKRRALIAAAAFAGVAWPGLAGADPVSFKVPMSGAQCVPSVEPSGTGTAGLTYDPSSRTVAWDIAYSGFSSATTMAHFHGPAKRGQNGPVVVWVSTQGTPPANPLTGSAVLTPEQAQQLAAGEWYLNVHSQAHPACEIRGQVTPPKN